MTALSKRRGLGVQPAECATGSWFCAKNTDCSVGWQWALNPACWGMSASDWAKVASSPASPLPGLPAPAVPAAPSSLPSDQTGAQAQATVNTLASTALTQTQQNINQFATTLPNCPEGAYGTGCTPSSSDTTVDCTDWWTSLTNPSTCLGQNLMPYIAVGIGVMVVILMLEGRR